MIFGWNNSQYEAARKWLDEKHGLTIIPHGPMDYDLIQGAWLLENRIAPQPYSNMDIKTLEEFRDALLQDAKDAFEAAPDLTRLLRQGETSIAMQAVNCEFAARMITHLLNAIEENHGRSYIPN